MSSLAYKCVFYRPENNAKGGPQGTEFLRSLNTKMKYNNGYSSKGRRKNGIICLFIMLASWIMVIKMSKMAHFLCFLLMPAKLSYSLKKIFTCIWKILFGSFRKCYGLLDSELPLARYQLLKIQVHYFFVDSAVFWYFFPRYLTNGNPKTN